MKHIIPWLDSAAMRGQRISDDLAKTIYQIRDEIDENNHHPSHSQIASRIHRSKSLVTAVLRRRIDNTTSQSKPVRGRRRKTTARQDHQITLSALRNRSEPSSAHIRAAGILLSSRTIRRRLKENGLRRRLAVQNVLNRRQRESRVRYCRENRERNWNNVIFSDECVVTLRKCRKVGRLYLYRRNGEKYQLASCMDIPKVRESGSVTIWGCFSANGFGCLQTFMGSMNSNRYTENTLPNYLIPSIHLLHPEGDFIFMQDNATPHTALITREWLRENQLETLPWPPYSPDLNPIENVWGLLKNKLYHNMPVTLNAVMDTVRQMWLALTPVYAQCLAGSMSKRCRLVILRRGLRV